MQANLPPILAHALAAFAPPQSVIHQCLGESDWLAADLARNAQKRDQHAAQRQADRLMAREISEIPDFIRRMA